MNLLHRIGRTPLVPLPAFSGSDLEVYGKLEYQNPSGSIKDRIAKRMIEVAVRDEELNEGMRIIDASSGNTGISLAMVGREMGYSVTIVTGEDTSEAVKDKIRAYDAEVEEVAGHFKACYEKIEELMGGSPGSYYWTKQASNPHAFQSNLGLGNEILREVSPDMLIASVGTGNTLSGVGRSLLSQNPQTQIHLVLPDEEYVAPGVEDPNESTVELPNYTPEIVTGEVRVSETDAIREALFLHDNGFPVGVSSGAVFAAAGKIAKEKEGTAILIFPDHKDRYPHIFGGAV